MLKSGGKKPLRVTKGQVITPVIIASVRTLTRQGVQELSSYTSSLQWPYKIGKIFERFLINFIVFPNR